MSAAAFADASAALLELARRSFSGDGRNAGPPYGLMRATDLHPCTEKISAFCIAVRDNSFRTAKSGPFDGEIHGHPHYYQKVLWLLVIARLVALQDGRARIRGGAGQKRRPRDARRASPALAIIPGALPHRQRGQGLGHAGDCRISQRSAAKRQAPAGESRGSRALPCHLWRDAFRLHQFAIGAADESESALSGLQGLDRSASGYRTRSGHLA